MLADLKAAGIVAHRCIFAERGTFHVVVMLFLISMATIALASRDFPRRPGALRAANRRLKIKRLRPAVLPEPEITYGVRLSCVDHRDPHMRPPAPRGLSR